MKRITAEQILLIHAAVLVETGGADGVRDPGSILGFVDLAFQTAFGKELYPDVFSKAAVFARSIMMSHAFLDGNKRTGMAVALTFLEDNGYSFHAPAGSIETFAVKLVVEKLDIASIAQWFKMHSVPTT